MRSKLIHVTMIDVQDIRDSFLGQATWGLYIFFFFENLVQNLMHHANSV